MWIFFSLSLLTLLWVYICGDYTAANISPGETGIYNGAAIRVNRGENERANVIFYFEKSLRMDEKNYINIYSYSKEKKKGREDGLS